MSKITMTDVAKRAGVSRKAASITFNNTPTTMVSQATREKILQAARELNYRPNYLATSLKSGKTRVIGLALGTQPSRSNVADPYQYQVEQGIAKAFEKLNYKFLHHYYHIDRTKDQSLELVQSRFVDGIIFVLISRRVPEFLEIQVPLLKEARVPFVLIHALTTPMDCHNVGYDCKQAGFMATGHLIEHGYAAQGGIGIVVRPDIPHIDDMLTGYKTALSEKGLPFEQELIFKTEGYQSQHGYELAEQILSRGTKLPRALFVTSDQLAYGMMKKFTEAGIKIPEDLALIGFDDNHSQEYLPTDLTSVNHPGYEKGREGAGLLLKQINNPGAMDTPDTIMLQPSLTIRKSCGCNNK